MDKRQITIDIFRNYRQKNENTCKYLNYISRLVDKKWKNRQITTAVKYLVLDNRRLTGDRKMDKYIDKLLHLSSHLWTLGVNILRL